MEKEKENTRFIIQRFDNYISSANTKGNFILAFNTFLLSAIITNYTKIKELAIGDLGILIVNILIISLLIVGLIIMVFVIKAVYPFLNSGNSSKNKYHSHIFFNSVAEFNDDEAYYVSYSKQSEKEVEEDMAKQAYQLSKGLKRKFCFLEWAMRFVNTEIVLFLLLLLTVIIF